MASLLSRRLINPNYTLHHHHRILNLFTNTSITGTRYLCSSSNAGDPKPAKDNHNEFQFQHQEITGPTVDRDLSALAEETRRSLDDLRRSVHSLSSALAVLSFAQLSLGALTVYGEAAQPLTTVQGVAAFAFPFSAAFLIRRAVQPMSFFRKVEEQGRLQILTLALQNVKTIDLLFRRTRVLAVGCVVGVSAGTVVALWMK